jgi:DNA polymerase III subunit gamma/tau
VLATTDPQKIPVTVLSRCLQFNLKQLPPPLITEHLTAILAAEAVAADAPALALIARAAQGSMRDALSLLDQAIAFGAGEVREPTVRSMLGAVDTQYVYRIAEALVARDGAALLAEADAMAARSVVFASALEELASLLHRVAIAQTIPAATAADADADRVGDLAAGMSAEEVQLAYQICVQGRADLALAPDEATGFTMTLLRLLAFAPGTATTPSGGEGTARPTGTRGTAPGKVEIKSVAPAAKPLPARGPPAAVDLGHGDGGASPPPPSAAAAVVALPADASGWPSFVAALRLTGMAAQLAAQTEFKGVAGNVVSLALPVEHKHLADRAYSDKLKAALDAATGRKLLLAFEVGAAAESSLAAQERRQRADQQARTEATFRDEPFVREVLERFDAKIKPDSIKPIS